MKKIAVGVLAGGKSTRMGENKALLQINGKRFLNQICGELGDFSQVIISAARKGDYEDLGLDVVYDEHQDIGPIEGIYQVLSHAQEEYVFICAADMPFITKELVAYIGFTPDGAGLHVNNWAVGLPILASAFCGTLGFPVLLNLMRSWRMRRPPKRWSLHTKLTLTTTFCIVIASFTWFLLMEWNNKLLFAGNGIEPRLWHAMVAAVMPRSSGFDLSWMPGVSDATKVFLSIVMFIGGGSTSTAGGIRVTTFAVTLLTCRAAFTGRHDINAFHRRIHTQAVMTAVAVSTACLMLVTVVSMALMIITGCSLCDALFDTCSAFGLGGYSVGVASESSPTVLYILAATMFIGRLGPLTIAYAISRPHNLEAVRYPTEQIVVG